MKYQLLCLGLLLFSCTSNSIDSKKPSIENQLNLIFLQDAYAWLDGGTKELKIISMKSKEGKTKISSTYFRITSKFEKKLSPNELYLETFNGKFGLNRIATAAELKEIQSMLKELISRSDEVKAINYYLHMLKVNWVFDPSQKEYSKAFNEIEQKFKPLSSTKTKLYANFVIEFINKKLAK